MKASKQICLIIALVLIMAFQSVLAYPGEVHDNYMLMALFGESVSLNKFSADEQKAIEALEAASYLTIDQFNGDGQVELSTLKGYHVPDIPKTIDIIDFTGNQYHRRYTHRGWNGPLNSDDRPYPKDKAHWNIRKRILKATVNKVFGFNKILGNVPFATKFSTTDPANATPWRQRRLRSQNRRAWRQVVPLR